LFEGDTDKRSRLMEALDTVNDRFGRFTAVPATQGFKQDWKMRADMKSPAYTTRITDVPSVRA
jgi:DNA polymerase V